MRDPRIASAVDALTKRTTFPIAFLVLLCSALLHAQTTEEPLLLAADPPDARLLRGKNVDPGLYLPDVSNKRANHNYRYSARGLPGGLSVREGASCEADAVANPPAGFIDKCIGGAPTVASASPSQVTITVEEISDQGAVTRSRSTSMMIRILDTTPTFTGVTIDSPLEFVISQSVEYQFAAALSDRDRPLRYEFFRADGVATNAAPNLPTGIRFVAHLRTLRGTPSEKSVQDQFTLRAIQGSGDGMTMVDRDIYLGVNDRDLIPSFGALGIADSSTQKGTPINPIVLIQASGGNGRLVYRLTPALPEGLFRRNFRISGTPTATRPTTEYTWSATDSNGSMAIAKFTITVTDVPNSGTIPSFGNRTIPDVRLPINPNEDITPIQLPSVLDNTGEDPIEYSLSPPNLPAGLRLTSSEKQYMIVGRTTTRSASREYRWTATDVDKDEAVLTFRLAVGDAATGISLGVTPSSVSEGAGTVTVNVTATVVGEPGAFYKTATPIVITFRDGTARVGDDYIAPATKTLTIPAEAKSVNDNFQLILKDDNLNEGPETIIVTGSTGVLNRNVNQALISITDNDLATLSIADQSISEGDSGITRMGFVVTLSNPAARDITVNYATIDGSAIVGQDYHAPDLDADPPEGTVTIRAGQTSATIQIRIIADRQIERNEEFFVELSSPPTGVTLGDARATGTILNDDSPTLSIQQGLRVNERDTGSSQVEVRVTLSQEHLDVVTVEYATAAETATAGRDFEAASGTLSFAIGQTTKVISITIHHDNIAESDEIFWVQLSNATNASIMRDRTGILIVDNDQTTISIDGDSVLEGDTGPTALNFTVTQSGPNEQDVVVRYSVNATTATAGTDFVPPSGVLRIPKGSTREVITVEVNGDNDVEADETLEIRLTSATNSTINNSRRVAVGTIRNDDTSTLSISDASIIEGDAGTTPIRFTVTQSNLNSNAVRVSYATSSGSARQGEDFRSTRSSLTMPAGETEAHLFIQVFGDEIVEANETFSVRLSNPTNSELGEAIAIGTILNDDESTIAIGDVTHAEGDSGTSAMEFTVTQSNENSFDVSIDYSTLAVTATEDDDYQATTGKLLIEKGSRTGVISVNVVGDKVVEPDETLQVTLANPINAMFATPTLTGIGTIENDDTAAISIMDAAGTEGNELNFVVTMSAQVAQPIELVINTSDGTAAAASDYTAVTDAALTIDALTTETAVKVATTGDRLPEEVENFTVTVAAQDTLPPNVSIADESAQGTIHDEDKAEHEIFVEGLSVQARALLGSVVATVGDRFRSRGDRELGLQLSGFGARSTAQNDWAMQSGCITCIDSLTGWTPAWGDMRVAYNGLSQAYGSTYGWGIWAAFDVQNFAGEMDPDNTFDGSLNSFYFGADMTVPSGLMLGIAVGSNSGETDFEFKSEDITGTSSLETSLISAYPYVRSTVGNGISLWGLAGFGQGDVTSERLTPDMSEEDGDLSMSMFAFGSRGALLDWTTLGLSWVGDFGSVNLEAEGPGSLANLEAASTRARLSVELAAQLGAGLEAFGSMGGRFDGGDAEGGGGMDVEAGVRFMQGMIEFELRGRFTPVHAIEEYQESGIGGRLRIHTRPDDLGLKLSVAPTYGQYQVRDWFAEQQPYEQYRALSNQGFGLQGEVGYGYSLAHNRGLLTPTLSVGSQRSGEKTTGLGLLYELGSGSDSQVRMMLQLLQRKQPQAQSNPSVMWRLQLPLK